MTAPADPPRGTRARAARLGAVAPVPKADEPDPGASRPSTPSGRSTRTRPPAEPTDPASPAERELGPDELAALEEQRAFLLGSLRDLEAEHDAGDIDDADYDALQDDYTARAAAVIRAIDGHHALVAARRPRTSWAKRIGALAVVLVIAVGAGVFVARSAGQRTAGETITGGIRQSTRDQLLQARQMLGTRDYDSAIKIYDQVLQNDPANIEALSYRGWMFRLKALSATSSADAVPLLSQAIKSIHDALAAKPDDGTSLVFLAVIYGDLDQPQKALDTLDQVPAGAVPDFMGDTVNTFRQKMQALLTAGSTTTTA